MEVFRSNYKTFRRLFSAAICAGRRN